MSTTRDYSSCTLQELFDATRERFEWWVALCDKRRHEAVTAAGVSGAALYEQWTRAFDSAKTANHNLGIRVDLYKAGLVTQEIFRRELLEAIERLDTLLEAHA